MSKEYLKAYYVKNKDKMNKQTVENRKNQNKDKYLAYQKKYIKNRRKIDLKFRIMSNMRKRICRILRDREDSSLELVGCSSDCLKKHLESRFKPGMSWNNYGLKGWHIDHIIPLSSASNPEELKKLCHYTNLQPLWAKENLIKGGKVPQIQS